MSFVYHFLYTVRFIYLFIYFWDGEASIDRQRESCWQLHARLQDSVAPWEIELDTYRERVSEDQISFCVSLHQLGVIWPTMAWYICPTCLPIFCYLCSVSLSLFFICLQLPFIPLIWRTSQSHSPTACVCVWRIISELDVCQNKGLISFTKN